jgi:hypothetical protein
MRKHKEAPGVVPVGEQTLFCLHWLPLKAHEAKKMVFVLDCVEIARGFHALSDRLALTDPGNPAQSDQARLNPTFRGMIFMPTPPPTPSTYPFDAAPLFP